MPKRLVPVLVFGAAVAAVVMAACARTPSRVARAPDKQAALRVMTYNVNYGIPGDAPTMGAIEHGHADVVVLQEVNDEWEQALRAEMTDTYPHMLFYTREDSGGIGMMSRLPLREKPHLIPAEGEGWFPALLLVFDSPLGPVQALVVHLRPPVSDGGSFVKGHFIAPAIHEKEITRFCERLDRALPTMVIGDFNEEEDGRAIAYLASAEWQMRSALPEFAPRRPTWRWPTSFGTLERRLDHIVYDVHLEPLSMEVIEAGRSDHYPVVGVFVLARS